MTVTTMTTTIPEPHAVLPDGRVLATRVLRVKEHGTGLLASPLRMTPWPGRVMRAHAWDDGSLVAGCAGLHAVAYRPDARPDNHDRVVAHVACSGRCAFSSRGLRAEEMEIVELVLVGDRDLARALHERYGVPVRVLRRHRPRSGRAALIDDNGTVSIVRYRDGQRHGRCETVTCDVTWVVEYYRAGLLHGRSIVVNSDGERIVYYYRDGVLVASTAG